MASKSGTLKPLPWYRFGMFGMCAKVALNPPNPLLRVHNEHPARHLQGLSRLAGFNEIFIRLGTSDCGQATSHFVVESFKRQGRQNARNAVSTEAGHVPAPACLA